MSEGNREHPTLDPDAHPAQPVIYFVIEKILSLMLKAFCSSLLPAFAVSFCLTVLPLSAQETTQSAATVVLPDPIQTTSTQTEISTATATQVESPPIRPKRGFGAPEWLAQETEAENFVERAFTPARTRPFQEAARGASPFSGQPENHQPAGSLSGQIVYAMAGHGWTYDEKRQLYYTQRGLTNGIIEDMGNLDQMHIFAHLCWNSGATVVPLRPIDHQPEERILDNTSAQTTFFGTWYQGTSPVFHGNPRDEVPYLFARASSEESAIARYRPWIPVAGEYPVYTWVRDGADRVSGQHYRIAHAGGITNVRVNHRRVGKGYVWLGTFYFNEGDQGYVDISNLVLDPYETDGSHVVVADGIRFGNGRGDVLRPAGRSGELREDEGDCYWIERSLGPTADRRLYTAVRDGAATISSPPRTAAYMNRETEGGYLDRIFISFHSNALAGKSRGCVALFNQSPAQRPDHQQLLAKFIGDQVNYEMLVDPPFPSPKWQGRERTTYNGINFGELRKDYLQNEMCATIVEVAFHDNEHDAKFLLDPRARVGMARATLRGMLKWLAHLRSPNAAIPMLPTPPEDPVIRSMAGGKLLVTWTPGVYGRIAGDPPTEYRLYRSRDGFSFDAGVMSQGESSMVIDPITTSGATYARVTALNAGGESWPSQVVAAITPEIADAISSETYAAKQLALRSQAPGAAGRVEEVGTTPTIQAAPVLPAPSSRGKVLLVAGITSLDASTNQRQEIEDFGARPGNTISTWRVRPRTLLNAPRMDAAADAVTSAARVFDSCNSAAVANGRVPLREYETIVWAVGRQHPKGGILTSATQVMLQEFLARGGKLFISGAHIAEALDGPAPRVNVTARDRQFLHQVLGTRYEGTNSELRRIAGVPGAVFGDLPEITLSGNTALGVIDALPSDIVAAVGDAGEVLRYRTSGTATAAVAGERFVLFAFPFENISTAATRAHVMHQVLQYLD